MKRRNFTRRNTTQYLRLGKKRKKLRKWRRPKGRHNKMRKKRRGYPSIVSIGYGSNKKSKNKPILVRNLNDLEKVSKESEVILGKMGKIKKIKIARIAKERKIKILNMNVEKFLINVEKGEKKLKSSENKSGGNKNETR